MTKEELLKLKPLTPLVAVEDGIKFGVRYYVATYTGLTEKFVGHDMVETKDADGTPWCFKVGSVSLLELGEVPGIDGAEDAKGKVR